MSTYTFAPLKVTIEELGKLKPPWDPFNEKWAYHLEVWDSEGNFFEAGWYSEKFNPQWTAAYERDFVEEFYGGYRGEEAKWRRKEAYRLKAAGQEFGYTALTQAAAIANRRREFEEEKEPRDWSPKDEFPREKE